MRVVSLESLPEFIAGDHTRLREILHPGKEPFSVGFSLAQAMLPPETWSSLHMLASSEVYYILGGRGRMEIDGELRDVAAGDTIYIPPQSRQRILSLGPDNLEFLCIVDPAWREQDETVLS